MVKNGFAAADGKKRKNYSGILGRILQALYLSAFCP
jgi:hypothetical protein